MKVYGKNARSIKGKRLDPMSDTPKIRPPPQKKYIKRMKLFQTRSYAKYIIYREGNKTSGRIKQKKVSLGGGLCIILKHAKATGLFTLKSLAYHCAANVAHLCFMHGNCAVRLFPIASEGQHIQNHPDKHDLLIMSSKRVGPKAAPCCSSNHPQLSI